MDERLDVFVQDHESSRRQKDLHHRRVCRLTITDEVEELADGLFGGIATRDRGRFEQGDGSDAEHFAPQVDEEFFDVFETCVEGTVRQPGDTADVAK